MATEKVQVVSSKLKKQTDKYSIYTIELGDGRKGEIFADLKPGEYDLESEEDPKYGWKFKLPKKGGGYSKGGYAPNYKLESMKLAVQLVCYGKLPEKDLFTGAEKIYNYLSK